MEEQNAKSGRIYVLDTTLRDGQQCPGAGMSFEQNLEYARLARELRVDVLEAGFPSASNLDFQIVRAIAEEVARADEKITVAGLCQLREEQVHRTIESLCSLIPYGKARVHTYLPVDPELMGASLGSKGEDRDRIVNDVYRLVKLAKDSGCEVQFSPEGYSRMRENFDFVTDVIRAAVRGGATIINCPDTIGGACDIEGEEYYVEKMNKHAAIIAAEFPDSEIIWSVHCHNDFGLAVQNTINGVFRGPARQIEGCINGIGERAGNAALEQCIMLIKCFGAKPEQQTTFHTNIVFEKLQSISDFVSKYMLPRQPHWPVSGENAAKHSSGGHTNAVLKNPMAYQPFDPSEIGKKISLLFGPLSGGNHAKAIIEGFGYVCADDEKAEIAQFIKDRYHQRRKGITDDELLQTYFEFRSPVKIDRIDYSKSAQSAKVKMHGAFFSLSGTIEEENWGRDSALAAVKNLIQKHFETIQILHHESRSETAGIDAVSVSKIIIADQAGRQFTGTGKDQDIEVSAIRALLDAVNRAFIDRNYSTMANRAKVEAGEGSGLAIMGSAS